MLAYICQNNYLTNFYQIPPQFAMLCCTAYLPCHL